MRELKFRAWSKKNTEMLHPDDVAVMPINDGVSPLSISSEAIRIRPDNDQFVLMQYTGLKDWKDVEIYEGDIITYETSHSITKGVVEYGNGLYSWVHAGIWFHMWDMHLDSAEVVGNIHENPELLK